MCKFIERNKKRVKFLFLCSHARLIKLILTEHKVVAVTVNQISVYMEPKIPIRISLKAKQNKNASYKRLNQNKQAQSAV